MNEQPVREERVIDIETRLAHQDQALLELNEAVTRQQAMLTKLERLCTALAERVAAVDEALRDGGAPDERPPHY